MLIRTSGTGAVDYVDAAITGGAVSIITFRILQKYVIDESRLRVGCVRTILRATALFVFFIDEGVFLQ